MWTALIPLNHGRPRKTRLAALYTEEQRNALALAMATHVVDTLRAVPAITRIAIVAPERPPLPTDWIADEARGLNAELAAACAPGSVLFIHADLPLLTAQDVADLLAAATVSGAAIAPDEAHIGTNAIALIDAAPFTPAFGPDSFARHRALLPHAAVVEAQGLALDVDEPETLERAMGLGFTPPS